MADIDLRAEPPRPALQEDRLIVELPLAGPVSKEWNACFTALARADDVPAEVKDSAKNPRIAVTVAPGLEPADMKATMDAARALASQADAREAAVAQWWQEQQRTNGSARQYSLVRPALAESDLTSVAPYMFWLMFRNVASAGFVFEDPVHQGVLSQPGCVLASPSWANDVTQTSQDYVYHWTRDAAVVAIELAAGPLSDGQPLADYVRFAQACQTSASSFGHFSRASFFVNGTPRTDWTDQTDGPALQTLAILPLFDRLDEPTQQTAIAVINANLAFLQNAYQGATYNIWEEEYGASFFARSVQLRCFQTIAASNVGIEVPAWLTTAIPWLQNILLSHWNGQYYQSLLPPPVDSNAPYDPNIDIVMAAIYGAVPLTDTKLLATAALLRSQWADPGPYFYPINGDDQQRGVGPMLGRYPGDVYDGDTDARVIDHPWAISTANFAELYYRLAKQITAAAAVPHDNLSADFFGQVGVDSSTSPADAATALQEAGDRMLRAIVFHSDHLELSEQFDATTGYEKSVRNLSWSYASFLSAIRAKTALSQNVLSRIGGSAG